LIVDDYDYDDNNDDDDYYYDDHDDGTGVNARQLGIKK
jgi:hypothetical protein